MLDCVWSRNLQNEEAMVRIGRSATKKKKMLDTKKRIPELWNLNFEHLVKEVLTVGAHRMRCNLSDSFHCNLTVQHLTWNTLRAFWMELSDRRACGIFSPLCVLIVLHAKNVQRLACHVVHSPTDAHLLKFWLQFTLKLDGFYMLRSMTIIRELAIEPG